MRDPKIENQYPLMPERIGDELMRIEANHMKPLAYALIVARKKGDRKRSMEMHKKINKEGVKIVRQVVE